MKNKSAAWLPFVTMPIFIPVYTVLDSFILVDIFGCGCVPSAQTNMLNIPFNANDLRLTVFSVLTVGLAVSGIALSKKFESKAIKMLYCSGTVLFNVLLAIWFCKTAMWT